MHLDARTKALPPPAPAIALSALIPPLLLCLAGVILETAEQSWVPLVILLGCGIPVFWAAGLVLSDKLAIQAFRWVLSVYVLAAAAAQVINGIYGVDFTMPDSHIFWDALTHKFGPIPLTLNFRMGQAGLDTVLSAYISQYFFAFVHFFDPGCGPWPALVVNAFFGALLVVVVCMIARLCFPDSPRAVLMAVVFCALCPVYLQFSVEPIRDGYVALLSAGMMYVGLLALRDPRPAQLVASLAAIVALSFLMAFARLEFVVIAAIVIGAYGLTGIFFVRRSKGSTLFFAAALLSLLVGGLVSYKILAPVLDVAVEYQDFYLSQATTAKQGLGILIVKLPLPLKVVAGYFYGLVFPIPMWAFFDPAAPPTVWLRSLNAFWTVLLTPLAFTGFIAVFFRRSGEVVQRQALSFIAIVFVVGGAMIGATTMEVRHYSAFYPAFVVLAAVPFAIGPPVAILLRSVTRTWLGGVLAIHFLWAVLKVL